MAHVLVRHPITMTALGLAAAVDAAGHDVVDERPDVVLADAITNAVPTVVVVPKDAPRRQVLGLLADDAAGIVTLHAAPAELGLAIDSAVNGWLWIDPRIGRLVALAAAVGQRSSHPLTPRQREIVTMAGTGMSNRQIAAELGSSPETVKQHLSSALSILGAADRLHAAEILDRL